MLPEPGLKTQRALGRAGTRVARRYPRRTQGGPADMSESTDGLMEGALEAARRAGEMALASFGRAIPVEVKPDGSPVTDADRAAERAAREWIERRFPADGILGEELG